VHLNEYTASERIFHGKVATIVGDREALQKPRPRAKYGRHQSDESRVTLRIGIVDDIERSLAVR